MITRTQIAHLAELVTATRPAWDLDGIHRTLNTYADTDTDPSQLFTAAIAAASDPSAATPSAIKFAKYWQTTSNPETSPDRSKYASRCKIEGHSGWSGNCPQCRSETIAPAEPKPCPKHLRTVEYRARGKPDGEIIRTVQTSSYYQHNCLECRREAAKEA